ncbi:MAG: hypothetical protein AAF998_23550 [Bacteroidota bacterium]
MSEKRPSGEEQRRKMKEEFKKELRARKEFAEKVQRLRQTKRIADALNDMSVDDDTDEWINKLNEETAFMDAKTELAMDSARVVNVPIEGSDGIPQPAPDLAASEEELRKIAAEEMVRKMKEEMAAEAGLAVTTTSDIDVAVPPPEAPVAPTTEAEPKAEAPDDDAGSNRPFRKMMDDIE